MELTFALTKRTYFALEHRFRPWRNDAKNFGSGQGKTSTTASTNVNRKHPKDDGSEAGQSPAKKRITKKGTATPVKKKSKKATSDDDDKDEGGRSDSGETLQKAVEKAVRSKKNIAVTVKDRAAGVQGTAVVIKAEDPGVSDAELLGEAF